MSNPFGVGTKEDAILMLAMERAKLMVKKKPTRRDLRMIFALDVAIKSLTHPSAADKKAE